MAGSVLFVGDSITDAGRRGTADGLGEGWVRMAAEVLRSRGETREILNRGVGGDRVVDLVARWRTDVLDLRPAVLTIYVGINDTWRRYDSGLVTADSAFESDYRGLLESAVAASDPRLILVQPFVAPVTEGQRAWGEDLDPKRAAIARLAEEFGAGLVPLDRRIAEEVDRVGAAAVAADGVHPTPHGARVIAEAWLEVFEAGPAGRG